MNYTFWIQEPYKTFMENGQKTVEWRLYKWKFIQIKNWDILQLEEWWAYLVLSTKLYESFEQMLIWEWIQNLLPDKIQILDWLNEYYKLYTQDEEKLYWVVAIRLKKVIEY